MPCNLEKNKGDSVNSLTLGGEGASLQFVTLAGSEPGQDIQNQRTGHKNMAFCEKTHHSFPSLIP